MGRPLLLASALVGIALAVTAGASARPQATSIQIGTVMNAAQEVPDADRGRERCARRVHGNGDEERHRQRPSRGSCRSAA